MTFVSAIGLINYGLVLLYGALLSAGFSGGFPTKNDRRALVCLCVFLIALQALCLRLLGLERTRMLYPLITHLPLWLTLTAVLKRPPGVALVSVLTAYFCCQIPRWTAAVFLYLLGTQLAYQISYTLSIFPLYFLLHKYFAGAAYSAMSYSTWSLCLFGGLPLTYYLFDYATTVYTDALYAGIRVLNEFLPAVMALFYVVFVAAYHWEMQKRTQAEMQNSILTMQLSGTARQMTQLLNSQQQTAAYRHDMRHHFAMLSGYLNTGEEEKARQYIDAAVQDIDAFTPKRYCDNVSVNLLLSSFAERARRLSITFSAEADIAASPGLPDTELCALLANGLENALNAAAACHVPEKLVRVNCQNHKGNLLILIRNPYEGKIAMADGLPQSSRVGHGFGVRSIRMIVEKHNGVLTFDTADGIFTLKAMLPACR